jgi:outer membrane protein assembly factor BamE (lipoprotein component of BamABCDE complex)
MPVAVDAKSLGFGSSGADVERIMGKPTSVVAVTGGEEWLYGRSRITLIAGEVAGWCKWDKPLPVNIGAAKAGAPPARIGMGAKELAASLGTPDSVAWFGSHQVWFYGMKSFTLKNGRVVPSEAILQMAPAQGQTKTTGGAKAGQSTGGSRSKSSSASSKPQPRKPSKQSAPAAKPKKR